MVSSLPQKSLAEISKDYRADATAPAPFRGDRSALEVANFSKGAHRSTVLGADPVALALVGELDKEEILTLLPNLLADEPLPTTLIAAALGRLAYFAPEEAISWGQSKLSKASFVKARTAIVAEWAKDKPEAALLWLREQIANVSSKNRYPLEMDFNTLLNSWARKDPATALQAVIDQEQPGTYNKWRGLARLVAREDMRDTVFDLVLAIEDETMRQKGLESLVGAWADAHPEAAAAWLDDQGDTDKKTQWSVSQRFQRADPEANADWLLARATPETRASSLITALAYWTRSDPASAETWVEKNSVADDGVAGQLAYGFAAREPDRAIA